MALSGLRRPSGAQTGDMSPRRDLESGFDSYAAYPGSLPSTPQQQPVPSPGAHHQHAHHASFSGFGSQRRTAQNQGAQPPSYGFPPPGAASASSYAHQQVPLSPSQAGYPHLRPLYSPSQYVPPIATNSPRDQVYSMPTNTSYSPNLSASPSNAPRAANSQQQPAHYVFDMSPATHSPNYFTPSQQHAVPPSPSSMTLSPSPTYLANPPPPSNRSQQYVKKHGFRRIRDASELMPTINPQPADRRANPTGGYLSPVKALTTHLLTTYHLVNPAFRYEASHNPRRVLTKPSVKAGNDGYDNEDADYILYVNDWLGSEDGNKYLILDILGQGTFGQVVKCQNMKTQEIVAVKVVKNKPAYFNQSMMEVTILDLLNNTWDPNDEHHILRLKDQFIHCQHLCLVFELLSSNLYELIKQNSFRGLSTSLVRVFTAQLLDALTVLNEARLIHCDLKPENILLKTLQSPTIKIIDFGSACHEKQTVYTYIQSRFYRSPEVLLGLPYSSTIDMWSLGCICVELFLGLPLFPGTSEYNQLSRIVELLGAPPTYMLEVGKQASNFFEPCYDGYGNKTYRLKSIEQYSKEHNTREQPSKRYFQATNLPDIVNTYPFARKDAKPADIEREMNNRRAFIDFVAGLLNLNPLERWTPQQARLHPFILGEPLTKPFVPPPSIKASKSQHQQMQPQTAMSPQQPGIDPKRPYGGLPPAPQPSASRTYQDAAAYNKHLTQQQQYAAMNAASAYRQAQIPTNPYVDPPKAAAPPKQASYQPYPPNLVQAQNARSQAMPSNVQLTNPPQAHQQQWTSRQRAPTITDVVPPQLQRIGMDLASLSGQSMTPVLRRDEQQAAWERRQGGDLHRKPSVSKHHPALDLLTQQAELGYRVGGHGSYGSQLAQQPFSVVVDPQGRPTGASNVGVAAPPQAHTTQTRYAPHLYDSTTYDDSLALLYEPLQASNAGQQGVRQAMPPPSSHGKNAFTSPLQPPTSVFASPNQPQLLPTNWGQLPPQLTKRRSHDNNNWA